MQAEHNFWLGSALGDVSCGLKDSLLLSPKLRMKNNAS
jgi:hypothetical protein